MSDNNLNENEQEPTFTARSAKGGLEKLAEAELPLNLTLGNEQWRRLPPGPGRIIPSPRWLPEIFNQAGFPPLSTDPQSPLGSEYFWPGPTSSQLISLLKFLKIARPRKLYLSFSDLMRKLEAGYPQYQQDLAEGLFAFGCAREHIFRQDGKPVRVNGVYKPVYHLLALHLIQPFLLKAEAEGRVTWRTLEESHMTYARLNSFLAQQGYPTVAVAVEDGAALAGAPESPYSSSRVKNIINADPRFKGLGLEVV